jgi:hypothetical protein
MGTLLLVSLLALGAEESPAIQGKWMIVYAEEGGRRNNSWEQRQATVTDDTLKYEAEGKEHSISLKFGPHQTVEATGAGGRSHRGVYIAGRDYLCISMESGRFGASTRGEGQEKGARTSAGGREKSSGSFILILRRQRSGAGSR